MEKTYTSHEMKNEITAEILADIKKESMKIKHRIVNSSSSVYGNYPYVVKRAREVVFKGSKYKAKDLIYKNLLVANVAFMNDEEFINVLVSHGFTINELNLLNNPNVLPAVKLKMIYALAVTLKKYYGLDVTTLAMNRINEIMSFSPNLLIVNQNSNSKKRSK